ncbi:hypothetical protein [Phytohabitans houttuyneae]|uniref:PknH-like extracellular domain-containing protein n=1 Tax=Phytohabitans houttuyneae TaxID=1076126 RepID=A0A6V8KLW5_9ACTN|nr:hypothetical protein [Phytohabitans houttuyneae]GFJ81645.1 hypothetical protein Phou_058250 [Phytohabitans houttuyneae]
MSGRDAPTRIALRCLVVALLVLVGFWMTPAPAAAHRQKVAPVPAGAFLQPVDLGGAATTPVTDAFRHYLRPPQPRAYFPYRSAALRRANATISILYSVTGNHPTVVLETVSIYRADGAQRYLRELRRALSRCGVRTDPTGRWSLLATGVAGRDSMLIRLQQRTEDFGGRSIVQSTYIVVARAGKAVVALADIGWETGNGHPDIVRRLAGPAVQRARTAG